MSLSANHRTVLRECAKQTAEIAALPIHKEKAELWRRLNDLEPVRPTGAGSTNTLGMN